MFLPQVFENLLKRSIRFFDVCGKEIGCNIRAAGKQKVFRCSSFSKMLPRCGRAAHICGANETVQESVSKLKESQLPLKSEGCNEIQGFRGNCDSQASWGCAPALPNRTQVVSLRRAAGNQKFFDPTIFQKCW